MNGPIGPCVMILSGFIHAKPCKIQGLFKDYNGDHTAVFKDHEFMKKLVYTLQSNFSNISNLTYSKTCVKWSLKNRQNKGLNDNWLLNEGQKYFRMFPFGAFCNTFNLH